ncbi:MAG: helix-turn-helix domain-containing protein [Ktedonobacteraceae bacterium]|jgi:excisionase family DNA binding protein
MQDDKMLTVEEIAERMRVNEKTVRSWITSGELPAFPVGKRGYRISGNDLHSFVEARKQKLQRRASSKEKDVD